MGVPAKGSAASTEKAYFKALNLSRRLTFSDSIPGGRAALKKLALKTASGIGLQLCCEPLAANHAYITKKSRPACSIRPPCRRGLNGCGSTI